MTLLSICGKGKLYKGALNFPSAAGQEQNTTKMRRIRRVGFFPLHSENGTYYIEDVSRVTLFAVLNDSPKFKTLFFEQRTRSLPGSRGGCRVGHQFEINKIIGYRQNLYS